MGDPLGEMSRWIGDLGEFGGLSSADVACIAAVPEAAIAIWKAGDARPPPAIRSVLSDLRSVVGRLSEYYDPRDVRLWLYAPHPQLNGGRAGDRIRENRSVVVLRILDRLDAAVSL